MNPIHNPQGERIDVSFAPPVAGSPCRKVDGKEQLVVIGHGVTGNKDRPWAVTLASALNAAGYASLRISFSGNGESEGCFENSCPSKEVSDLKAVLDAFADRHLTFVGHSMGGAVGVISAAQDPRIARLISLAGMVHTADFAARKFGEVTPGAGCMWDIPACPLSQSFVDDMNSIDSVLNLAGKVTVPWLLVHGTQDGVVPIEESEQIAAAATADHQLHTLSDCDHVFTGEHASAMAGIVVKWLNAQS
jgi:uncharacterized protein